MADKKIIDLAYYLCDVKMLQRVHEKDDHNTMTEVRTGHLLRMVEDVLKLHAEPKPPLQQTAESYDKFWDDDIRSRFAHVEAVVEATNEEKYGLWHRYHHRPEPEGRAVTWHSGGSGHLPCAGRFGPNHEFDVYVSLFVDKVDGHNILFYHPTSLYVNHDIVRDFIKDIVPERAWYHHTDATNFFNAINGVARDKEKATTE